MAALRILLLGGVLTLAVVSPALAGSHGARELISVSPVIVQRTIDPGGQTFVELRVANTTTSAQTFEVRVVDFAAPERSSQDKQYRPSGQGASGFLNVEAPTFELAAGASRAVRVRVRIPADTAPGGRYATLFLQTRPAASGTVGISASIGVPFLLTVDGELHRKLEISLRGPRLHLTGKAMRWRVVVRNRGNVHERVGTVVAFDPLVGEVVRQKLVKRFVLPGATRSFPIEVQAGGAKLVMEGSARWDAGNGRTGTASHRAFVAEWWLLAAFVAAIGLLVWRLRRQV